MNMKVKEVSHLSGISVRTLHHYDEIGLLKPESTSSSGYRLYSEDNLETLQQILFFRELDFPLKQIKGIIHSPSFDRKEALTLHRQTLLDKRKRIDKMIATIDKTTQYMKGDIHMSNKEKFAGFDFSDNRYEEEARKRWGNKAVDKTNATISALSHDEQQSLGEEMTALFEQFATIRHLSPTSENAQSAMKEWYHFLNKTGHYYSLAAFKGLSDIYVSDERFTKNIDQFGEGLAQFMCEAMTIYAEKNEE